MRLSFLAGAFFVNGLGMYLDAEIRKMYGSRVTPRIAAQITGMGVRDVIRQYGMLATLNETQAYINSRDLKRIAAAQVKMTTVDMAVSDTTDCDQAKHHVSMVSEYFAAVRAANRSNVVNCSKPVMTLPISLQLLDTRDSLASAQDL